MLQAADHRENKHQAAPTTRFRTPHTAQSMAKASFRDGLRETERSGVRSLHQTSHGWCENEVFVGSTICKAEESKTATVLLGNDAMHHRPARPHSSAYRTTSLVCSGAAIRGLQTDYPETATHSQVAAVSFWYGKNLLFVANACLSKSFEQAQPVCTKLVPCWFRSLLWLHLWPSRLTAFACLYVIRQDMVLQSCNSTHMLAQRFPTQAVETSPTVPATSESRKRLNSSRTSHAKEVSHASWFQEQHSLYPEVWSACNTQRNTFCIILSGDQDKLQAVPG